VPLYNFATNVNAYSEIQPEDTVPWVSVIGNDIQCISEKETELMVLNIRKFIQQSYYTFTIQMPIGLFFRAVGTNLPSTTSIYLPGNTLQITSIDLNVYYNDGLVTPLQTYTCNILPPVADSRFVFDINFVPKSTSDSFSFVAYAGVLTLSNVSLYTQPGYIYDIKPTFHVKFVPNTAAGGDTMTINYDTYFGSQTTYGVYCNLSSTQANVVRNCSLETPLPYSVPTAYPTFSLNGV
jgi:hypothetical protein